MTTNSTCFLVRSGVNQGRAVLRVTGNSYVNVIANSTVNSEISNSNDAILGCTITGMWWSAQTNPIQVYRPANSTANSFVLSLSGSGQWCRSTDWQGESSVPTSANVSFVIKDSASTLYVELTKVYAGTNPPTGTH